MRDRSDLLSPAWQFWTIRPFFRQRWTHKKVKHENIRNEIESIHWNWYKERWSAHAGASVGVQGRRLFLFLPPTLFSSRGLCDARSLVADSPIAWLKVTFTVVKVTNSGFISPNHWFSLFLPCRSYLIKSPRFYPVSIRWKNYFQFCPTDLRVAGTRIFRRCPLARSLFETFDDAFWIDLEKHHFELPKSSLAIAAIIFLLVGLFFGSNSAQN